MEASHFNLGRAHEMKENKFFFVTLSLEYMTLCAAYNAISKWTRCLTMWNLNNLLNLKRRWKWEEIWSFRKEIFLLKTISCEVEVKRYFGWKQSKKCKLGKSQVLYFSLLVPGRIFLRLAALLWGKIFCTFDKKHHLKKKKHVSLSVQFHKQSLTQMCHIWTFVSTFTWYSDSVTVL